MTPNLDWQRDLLTDAERNTITSSVLTVAVALEVIARSADIRSPADGTTARSLRESSLNHTTTQGDTHIDQAFNMIASSCLTAADHMRAFVIGARSGRTTVSNWTLARAAIEALGRAHYLLDVEDTSGLLARYVAVAHAELRYAAFNDYSTREGEPLDVQGYEADLDKYLVTVGVASVKAPGLGAMASRLLEDAAPGSNGRQRYSQLSGAAHGQTPTLGMFRTTDSGPLIFPRALVLEVAHQQIGCAIHVGDKIALLFTQPGSTRERWVTARSRTLASLGIQVGGTTAAT